jgi:hypothetical protein
MEKTNANGNGNGTIPAVLVSMSAHGWWASKVDREVTSDTQARWNASSESGRFHKKLLQSLQLRDIFNLDMLFRTKFRMITLPWMGEVRLLPGRLVMDFFKVVEEYKQKRQNLVESLLSEYDHLKEEAKRTLGQMFKEQDYPTKDQIRQKFYVDIRVLPPPSEDQFSKVPHGEAIRDMFIDQVKLQINEANQELVDRLRDAAESIKALKDTKKLQDRRLEAIRRILEGVQKLNIFKDAAVEDATNELLAVLDTVSPDDLRSDMAKREDLAREAEKILSKLEGVFA